MPLWDRALDMSSAWLDAFDIMASTHGGWGSSPGTLERSKGCPRATGPRGTHSPEGGESVMRYPVGACAVRVPCLANQLDRN